MIYLVGEGHDVAQVDLDVIVPQPFCPGIKPTTRTYSTGGTPTDLAPYAELIWNTLPSATVYQTLLAQFGLDDADSANVTVYIRNGRFTAGRYNAVACLPANGQDAEWDRYFIRGVTIILTHLEAL